MLCESNAFGNKFRWTDVSGNNLVGTVLNQYVVDNLTGLGWADSTLGSLNYSFNDLFGIGGGLETYFNGSSLYGYNDWFAANIQMIYNISNYASINASSLQLPRRRITSNSTITSTTYRSSTTNCMRIVPSGGYSYFLAKTYLSLTIGARIQFK